MTRVPKFRAWDKEHKEMFIVEDMVWSYQNNGEHYFLGIGNAITFWRDADEIELMQSTGLKDKNGVEVYEGDIVSMTYEGNSELLPCNGVVRMSRGRYIICDDKNERWAELYSEIFSTEIIGNIYENKELLE